MISAGIVAEYNPFHNGHLYHLKKTREISNADVIIAVMSGNFLQRGEPALVTKLSRTKMALAAGCDLVVELPYVFSTQKAEIFARGAVHILQALKCDFICFGSESGNIETFIQAVKHIEKNKEKWNMYIKQFVKEGISYAKAASNAFKEISPDNQESSFPDLSMPNNILGYHYVREIYRNGFSVKPLTVKRIDAGYHDEHLSKTKISSATGIRKAIFQNQSLQSIKSQVPGTTYEELEHFLQQYRTFVNWESFWPFLKYKILQSTPGELKELYEIEEGLEYRIIRCAKRSGSFHDFMTKLKTKRYTWTRLQRACLHVLTNTDKTEMKRRMERPEYIRILGFNETGRKYLNEKKKQFSLPVISTLSKGDPEKLMPDVKASSIYSFAFSSACSQKIMEEEYKKTPVIKK